MKLLLRCLYYLLFSYPILLQADTGFEILDTEIYQFNENIILDAQIQFKPNETVMEAIENGVPINVLINVEIYHQRGYLWDKRIVKHKIKRRLRYLALAQVYQIVNLDDNFIHNFATATTALRQLCQVKSFPLMAKSDLLMDNNYYIRLRALLDIESLPLPLRPAAYLSSKWRLDSDWYRWQLQQR